MIHYNVGDLLIHGKTKQVYIIYSVTFNQYGITNMDAFLDGTPMESFISIKLENVKDYEYIVLPYDENELAEVFKKYKVKGCKDLGLNIYDGIRNG